MTRENYIEKKKLTIPQCHTPRFIRHVLLNPLIPVHLEFLHECRSFLDKFLGGLRLPHTVLALELRVVLLQVLLDLLLLLLAKQDGRPGPPEDLGELLQVDPLQDLALERPNPVT